MKSKISKTIFREYDIRGIINETLFEQDAYLIGKGFCSLNSNNNFKTIAVGRDGRLSSPKISQSLIQGILQSGIDVIDIGCGPTPMLYFTRPSLKVDAAIMVTGSHNPPDHNGFKIMIGDKSFFGNDIQNLYKFICKGKFICGNGKLFKKNLKENYINALLNSSGPFPNIKVIWDCGNGATGEIISSLISKLPGDHQVLFEEIDGNFPNHHPDPVVDKNLEFLREKMFQTNADLGIAFDGDGDRIGILSKDGKLISGDILTAFLAGSILNEKKKEKVIVDVKCSQASIHSIEKQNGIPIICRTGHSIIKTKLKEMNAPLAGEMSGHIFFNDKWNGVDDAPYAALRVLEEIKRCGKNLNEFLEELSKFHASPEVRINCDDNIKFSLVEKIKFEVLKNYKISDVLSIDGVRVSSEKGWWLIRASNTQAALIARAEGVDQKSLKCLLQEIEKYLSQSGVEWNFKDIL